MMSDHFIFPYAIMAMGLIMLIVSGVAYFHSLEYMESLLIAICFLGMGGFSHYMFNLGKDSNNEKNELGDA